MKAPHEILDQFKIVPTEHRVALLKLMLDLKKRPFSVQDLEDSLRTIDLAVSHNTLVTTLLLFVTRKIIRAFPAPKTQKKKGRPVMLYLLDPALTFNAAGTQGTVISSETENVKAIDFPSNEAPQSKRNPDNF